MPGKTLISSEIDQFYTTAAEDKRLSYGLGPLELERNQELISRFLPDGGIVLDIGGGPGIYAEWLAALGQEVHLVEPVNRLVQQAQKRALKSKKSFGVVCGEVRALDFGNGFADVVILHGPLYHLQSRADRIEALREASRVLKPGGVVLGFAISYPASTLTGLMNGLIHQPLFYQMCTEELVTGRHNTAVSWPGILPEAYFHRAEDLQAEAADAGFQKIELFAVEGIIWLDGSYFETRSNPAKKEAMMALLRQTEQDPGLMALSPHIMLSGRKP